MPGVIKNLNIMDAYVLFLMLLDKKDLSDHGNVYCFF